MGEKRESARSENEAEIREDGEVREAWIPIREAAAALGISVRAVQLQAQSGKIASRRDGKRLYVNLGSTGATTKPERESRSEDEANREVREVSLDSPLLQHLQSEVAYLRGALDAASVERSELRRLLLVEQDANKRLGEVLQLMAGPKLEDPEPAPIAEDTAPASPVPTVDVPPADVTNNAPVAEAAAEPIVEAKRGFWAGLWRTVFEPWRE